MYDAISICFFFSNVRWTGSNTNPKNNDGQGLAGTDRSNIVVQEERAYLEDSGSYWVGVNKSGHWGRSYPARLDDASMLGMTRSDLTKLALLAPGEGNRLFVSVGKTNYEY